MAPAQSYLDLDNTNFSRLVNMSEPSRGWHPEFSYYGENVYAYLLAKYGSYIDLISMQLYESYSRAAQAVVVDEMSAAEYIVHYMQQLSHQAESMLVQFSQDDSTQLVDQQVSLPRSKLVIGLANGWALSNHEKHFFAPLNDLEKAWNELQESQLSMRGFMFWTIDEEGSNNVNLSKGLSRIMGIQMDSKATEL
jgi:chitinase